MVLAAVAQSLIILAQGLVDRRKLIRDLFRLLQIISRESVSRIQVLDEDPLHQSLTDLPAPVVHETQKISRLNIAAVVVERSLQ